ncbi:MAG TPA: hypothetical protein V6D19_04340 [Stenomitos sp.]
MDVAAQVQALVDEAPEDPSVREGVQVVASVLSEVAQGLGHAQYYVLQNFQQQWQVTTLQHRSQTDLQKTVIYAYGSLADATRMGQSAELMAAPINVVPLLFQFFSIAEVDSLIFIDAPNNPNQVRELEREDLQVLVESRLSQHVLSKQEASGANRTEIA